MNDPASQSKNVRSYDLVLRTTSSRLLSRDRGVTLTDGSIAWSVDGAADEAPLANIVEIRLQTGGAPTRPISMCRIRIADGYEVVVNKKIAIGADERVQHALGRNLGHGLRRGLGGLPGPATRFVAGFPERKFWIIGACVGALGLMVVVPSLAVMIAFSEWRAVGAMFTGAI